MKLMRRAISLVSILLVLLISLPSAFALGPADVFRYFFEWMRDTYVMFFVTFIFLMIMFYGVFAAGLARVTAFQKGGGISRPGKMVALSLSVIATIGILFVIRSAPRESMKAILSIMGWFGMVAFSLLIFGITYLNFKGEEKTWPLAFFSTGVGMVVFGLLADSISWWSFGWTFVIIGIIWFIFAGNAGGEGEDDVGMIGRRPDDADPDRPPHEPEEPDGPGRDNTEEIRGILDNIRDGIDAMDATYHELVTEGNAILQQNHDYHRGFAGSSPDPGVEPVSGEQFFSFMEKHNTITTGSATILGYFDTISGLGSVSDEALNEEIAEQTGRHTTLLVNFRRYIEDFHERLRTNEPPDDMYS